MKNSFISEADISFAVISEDYLKEENTLGETNYSDIKINLNHYSNNDLIK
jgi:hypothetical protein